VRWAVEIGEDFEAEFDALPAQVRTEILANQAEAKNASTANS